MRRCPVLRTIGPTSARGLFELFARGPHSSYKEGWHDTGTPGFHFPTPFEPAGPGNLFPTC